MSVVFSAKVLIPLATAGLAGALAVGSGADFTSASGNTASSVVSGTLTQSNSKADAAIFNLTNMKPGDVLNGTVTLTNTGSLPAIFSLSEAQVTNGFTPGTLTETITDVTNASAPVTVYSGNFGGAGTKSLGTWAANEAHTYKVSVTLVQSATNTEQGKTATSSFSWNATQTAGTTFNQ